MTALACAFRTLVKSYEGMPSRRGVASCSYSFLTS